jgi:probable F420-dependent oxidoreductase
MSDRILDELGYYLLAGAGGNYGPGHVMEEARRGEELGLGTGFISERWNVKEAVSISGAGLAVTTKMNVGTAATNVNTRHPLINASAATTMHRLSGGRFILGVGRGVPGLYSMFGIPNVTTRMLGDFATIMRRLWNGEAFDYDGPLGTFPTLYLDGSFAEEIPLALMAFGPESLKLGGRAYDHVILHTYFAPETLQRCVRTVKEAAEQAGRDPDAVKVWSCLATVGDHLPENLRRRKLVGRLATYMQGYGDLMVSTNQWDPTVLQRFREDSVVQSMPGAIDGRADDEQMKYIESLLPEEWIEHAATGSPADCARRVRMELELGADRVIMHGAEPEELAPIVAAYRAQEPVLAS